MGQHILQRYLPIVDTSPPLTLQGVRIVWDVSSQEPHAALVYAEGLDRSFCGRNWAPDAAGQVVGDFRTDRMPLRCLQCQAALAALAQSLMLIPGT